MQPADGALTGNDQDCGFTLIELLVVVAVSAFMMSAMVACMLLGLRMLVGLDENAGGSPGVQNEDAVNAQLDANLSFPRLFRDVTSDIRNSRSADIQLTNAMPCAPVSVDPALPTTNVIFSTRTTDAAGNTRRIAYQYSTNVPRRIAQIARYACDASGNGTTAQVLATGLSSTQFPTAAISSGLIRVSLYSVTGRLYAIDALPRAPGSGAAVTPSGQALTSMLAQDTNSDALIDRVVATFGSTTPPASCTGSSTANAAAAWSIRPVGGASVTGATWSGSTATLTLTGAPPGDTTINQLSVSFLPPTGCTALLAVVDSTPVDDAAAVLIDVQRGTSPDDGNGLMQRGDSLHLVFSEPIKPGSLPAGGRGIVTLADLGLTDFLIIADTPGAPVPRPMTQSPVAVNGDHFTGGLGTVLWSAALTIELAEPNRVKVTLDNGGCSGSCSSLRPSPLGALATFVPATTITGYDNKQATVRVGTPAPVSPFRLW